MLITFCGVRGSTPAPAARFARYGGNTSCVAVSHSPESPSVLALDAGTGLANLTSLLDGDPFAGTILLTHLHWDHSLGLPFFEAGDRDDARVRLLLPDQQDGSSAEAVAAEAVFGHASAEYGVRLAIRAGARRVALFHHKPSRTDAELDEVARRFATAPIPVVVATEGLSVEL